MYHAGNFSFMAYFILMENIFFEQITSAQNALVKSMRSLAQKKGRMQTGCFLIEGRKMLFEALDAGVKPEAVLIDHLYTPENDEDLFSRLEAPKIRTAIVTSAIMESVCDTKTPQGIVASIRIPESGRWFGGREIVFGRGISRAVVLCGVQDPGNVGTIWRTADAAGFDALILSPECADPFNPKVLRGTMGSAFRLPALTRPLEPLLIELSSMGFTHYAATLSSQSVNVMEKKTDFTPLLSLVIGGEAKGIPTSILDVCNIQLHIPMLGGTESLNAAIAAGILMYKIAYA